MADAPATDDTRVVQAVVTFTLGAIGAYFAWPYLDGTSRMLMGLFAVLAGLSIHSGTWMADSRSLRKNERESRQKAYGEIKSYITGKHDRAKRD